MMACHLNGGSCPHDFGFGRGGGYIVSGSSSYGGVGNYTGASAYNARGTSTGQYNGFTKGSASYNPLLAGTSLAAYAANPEYTVGYNTADRYASQSAPAKNTAVWNPQKSFSIYRTNQQQSDIESNQGESFITGDVARPTATIDDTVDTDTVVAVQRDFLEQMIRTARQQATPQRQLLYVEMYQ